MSKYECNRRSDLGRVQRDGRRNSCGRGNVTRTMGAFWRSSHMSSLGSACAIAKGEAHATEAPNHEYVGHGRAEAVETGVNGLDVLRCVVGLSVARLLAGLSQPSDDVSIRGVNQGFEWWTVNGMRRSDFDVAHVLSCAIEKTYRIGQRRAVPARHRRNVASVQTTFAQLSQARSIERQATLRRRDLVRLLR